jgi:hypothetical protein
MSILLHRADGQESSSMEVRDEALDHLSITDTLVESTSFAT